MASRDLVCSTCECIISFMPLLFFGKKRRSALLLSTLIFSGAQFGTPQETTFKTQSNLVSVPTMVIGQDGNPVYGLRADDFVIEDDGVPQLVHLDDSAETEGLSLVIAVQCGRRARREFDRMKGLASMLDPALNEPNTEAALVYFDSKLNLVRDFSSDADLIETDLKNLQPGDGGAAILDAVALSVRSLERRPPERRRVLLLISETRDQGSHFHKLDDVISLIGSTNTAVYALTFSPYISQQLDAMRGTNSDEWPPNVDILEKLAAIRQSMKKNAPKSLTNMTGGEYATFTTRDAFETSLVAFANHLHSRYLLSFQPEGPHPGLHTLSVRLKKAGNQSVLFRRSYWVGSTQ